MPFPSGSEPLSLRILAAWSWLFNMTKTSFILFLALAVIAAGEDLLVTSAGKYTNREGKISVEIAIPDKTHVSFRVNWEMEKPGEAGATIVSSRSEGPVEPLPVAADRWAFYLVGKDQLWLFDGKESFYHYKGTKDGLSSSASCSDPRLAASVPQPLKKWIEGRSERH